ncbi:MAG TPA: DUF188 domain-containing protein [Sphaerochaeta sp.]|jgi:uncharacterized protein YaiI (UPF0178 family)|nr:DUF188 domain-containing protein [Spirochaetota bacterium]NLV61418.1 hypothetical protein [Spirochaetales bacterium]HOE84615.1 DUF188 domain-containing protein [Sphaerochaeta sp.]HOQ95363.1 DUF188 domain-containing protein [Sphaerochaeta sp.]HPK47991.1 DUF188 domain-containing protein [Sphaerochaeta sp.]
MVTLYVDADSVPLQIRSIILRRVAKEDLAAIFVADRPLKDVKRAYEEHTAALRAAAKEGGEEDAERLRSIRSPIAMVVVSAGLDSADDWIVEHSEDGSVAITHDVPLASRLAQKGLVVLDDRGGVYTRENIGERLSMRNLMGELREMGIFSEQHKRMDNRQVKAFSDAFDGVLHTLLKQS